MAIKPCLCRSRMHLLHGFPRRHNTVGTLQPPCAPGAIPFLVLPATSPLVPPQPPNWILQPPRTVDQPQKFIHGGLSPGTCLEKPDGGGPLARALPLRQKLLDLGEPPVVDPIIKDFVGLQRPPHVVVFMELVAIDDTDRAL